MSERERAIIAKIAEALPRMSEFEKGYMVGVAETRAASVEKERKEAEPEETG